MTPTERALVEALRECRTYLETKATSNWHNHDKAPNEAECILRSVRTALARAEQDAKHE